MSKSYWKRGGIDFSRPFKLWSSGGQWTKTELVCFVDNYAIVKLIYPNKSIGYKGLDLDWYLKVGTPSFEGQEVFKQLRNVKDSKPFSLKKRLTIQLNSLLCNKFAKELLNGNSSTK